MDIITFLLALALCLVVVGFPVTGCLMSGYCVLLCFLAVIMEGELDHE